MTPVSHTNPLRLDDHQFLARAESMCGVKAAYVTRAEATTFARRSGFGGTPYACPWCGNWHLTSYDRAQSRAFKRRLSRLLRTEDAS